MGVNRLPARQFPSLGAIQMDDTGGWTAMLDSSGRARSGTSKYSTKSKNKEEGEKAHGLYWSACI